MWARRQRLTDQITTLTCKSLTASCSRISRGAKENTLCPGLLAFQSGHYPSALVLLFTGGGK